MLNGFSTFFPMGVGQREEEPLIFGVVGGGGDDEGGVVVAGGGEEGAGGFEDGVLGMSVGGFNF